MQQIAVALKALPFQEENLARDLQFHLSEKATLVKRFPGPGPPQGLNIPSRQPGRRMDLPHDITAMMGTFVHNVFMWQPEEFAIGVQFAEQIKT